MNNGTEPIDLQLLILSILQRSCYPVKNSGGSLVVEVRVVAERGVVVGFDFVRLELVGVAGQVVVPFFFEVVVEVVVEVVIVEIIERIVRRDFFARRRDARDRIVFRLVDRLPDSSIPMFLADLLALATTYAIPPNHQPWTPPCRNASRGVRFGRELRSAG